VTEKKQIHEVKVEQPIPGLLLKVSGVELTAESDLLTWYK
jgi:hypothetical protein